MSAKCAVMSVIGILILLVGAVCFGVQCDQIIRDHQLLSDVQARVAALEAIPGEERDPTHGQRLIWAESDVDYFQNRILPRDYAMQIGFVAVFLVGALLSTSALVLGLAARKGGSKM